MRYRAVCKVSILDSQDGKSSARRRKLCRGLDVTEEGGYDRGREGEIEESTADSSRTREHKGMEAGRLDSPFVRRLLVTKISKNQIEKRKHLFLLGCFTFIFRHSSAPE